MFRTYRYQTFLFSINLTESLNWKKKEVMSPCTWGCTETVKFLGYNDENVPMHMGVYREANHGKD